MKITCTNLYALASLFTGLKITVDNQIEAPSVPHIRRCVTAGLVVVNRTSRKEKGTLTLTEKGINTLKADASAYRVWLGSEPVPQNGPVS